MMIHTAHLFIELTEEHIYHKDNNHGKLSFNQIMKLNNLTGITARQYKTHGVYRCSIIIDVTKILNSGYIVEADYWRIKRFVKLSIKMVYGDESLYDHHNLIRIDYRIDRKVPLASDRELYLLLYNKTKSNFKRLKKQRNNYKTTIYHSCKSIQTTVYDKNEHCKYQNREPMEWERDMIRFEIRLKNPHIYNRVKETGEMKCLYSFFKVEVFQEYVQKYLLQIFPSGDFYCFDLAEELISSSQYSLTVRRRLKHFLVKVSNGGLDTPTNKYYTDWISKETHNKRIQILNELDVNPITIPQVYKVSKLPSLLKSKSSKEI